MWGWCSSVFRHRGVSKAAEVEEEVFFSDGAQSAPRLGMLVDRSSFDETDSYGVDQHVLENSFDAQKLNSPQSTVMKSGKVRRRMRWRPRVRLP